MLTTLRILSTCLAFSFAASGPVAASPGVASPVVPTDAEGTFKIRHEKVIQLVKKGVSNEVLQQEVDKLLNYRALAETSLGGAAQYEGKCAPRCAEFETVLARLIRENYLKRIRSDKKYEMTYLGEEVKGRATHVRTQIGLTRDGKPEVVEVVYMMEQTAEGWKVSDIITDGVSLAKNYRFEFNKILKDKGIDELISRLDSKLSELTVRLVAPAKK